jgi:hypothetical protein
MSFFKMFNSYIIAFLLIWIMQLVEDYRFGEATILGIIVFVTVFFSDKDEEVKVKTR